MVLLIIATKNKSCSKVMYERWRSFETKNKFVVHVWARWGCLSSRILSIYQKSCQQLSKMSRNEHWNVPYTFYRLQAPHHTYKFIKERRDSSSRYIYKYVCASLNTKQSPFSGQKCVYCSYYMRMRIYLRINFVYKSNIFWQNIRCFFFGNTLHK